MVLVAFDAPSAFVGVSGGVVALSGSGRLLGLVSSVLVTLGSMFLVGLSFGGAQSSDLPSVFVFPSRFLFLVSGQTVSVLEFVRSCP